MLKLDYHDDFLVPYKTFCVLPLGKLILNPYGDVTMCCHQVTMLGSLAKGENLLDVWRSQLVKNMQKVTMEGKLHPVCTSWNSCPYIVKPKKMFTTRQYRRFFYPTGLEICLPDKHCNIGGENPSEDSPACIMCRRNFMKVTSEDKDYTDLFCEQAKPLMPWLKLLMVLGTAEPFWKDALFKIYEKLEFHRYKHRITFNTNTNGTCLNDRTTRRFFEETQWSDIQFSFDAATPETYKKIRRLNAFDTIVKNARNYVKVREEYGGKARHKVVLWNNINMLNVGEMSMMVDQAADIGFDEIVMLPTYDLSGIVQLGDLMMNHKNIHIFREAAQKAREQAKKAGISLTYLKSFDEAPPPLEAVQNLVQLTFPN